MKIIGIDYGGKRVGIALSDDNGTMAFPKAIFPNDRMLMTSMVELIKKEGVKKIIIGESKNKDGEDNPIMQKVKQFAGDLERETGLDVYFEPEYYTSLEARRLTEGKALVDAEAAAIILNSYIDSKK